MIIILLHVNRQSLKMNLSKFLFEIIKIIFRFGLEKDYLYVKIRIGTWVMSLTMHGVYEVHDRTVIVFTSTHCRTNRVNYRGDRGPKILTSGSISASFVQEMESIAASFTNRKWYWPALNQNR